MSRRPIGRRGIGTDGTSVGHAGGADSETGNYYDYARYYNPRIGRPDAFTDTGRSVLSEPDRFMTPDPSNAGAIAGNPQSWNAYSYVLNSPETLFDPLGMSCTNSTTTGGENTETSTVVTVQCSPPPPVPPGNLFNEQYFNSLGFMADVSGLPLSPLPSPLSRTPSTASETTFSPLRTFG